MLKQDFAVILLDVQMPGLNGFETAELIKGRERSRLTPIIFLTAINKDEEYVFRGYSVGAVDYMFKPFQPDVLRSKVSVFVDLHLKNEQIKHQEQVIREGEMRELELSHRTALMEAEAQAAADLKAMNEQLQERQHALEQAISARSRFYASMSHELRTPINAIMGYNALLLDRIYGPLNEKQEGSLKRTRRAAKHLLELVNDVLDLSKIEAGKLELHLEPVNVTGIVEELMVTVSPLAEQQGSPLTTRCEGEVSTIITDPRRVRQILLNLLSNAIKFGRGRPIQIVCSAQDDGGVQVRVADQGEGIDPADQEKIFDEFVQLSASGGHEGTGLGLPISRRLATLLNGSLDVTSEPDVGSTFVLELPPRVDDMYSTEGEPARKADVGGIAQSR